jgi:sarcosine oxidase subunit gamma
MADLSTLKGLRRSPLHDMAEELRDAAVTGDRSVRLLEWPFLTMVSIRVAPDSDAARSIEQTLGTSLPRTVGEIGQHDANTVLWLGPDEWLVVSRTEPATLVERLEAARAGAQAQIVDVSANRTVLEVAGTAARDVLEKGCPADLHPRAFADNTAIVTSLARVPVLLWKVDAQQFRVLPRTSLAPYVAAWLLDAVQELAPRASAAKGA